VCRIIVGVKYCFRYNARNRALARGEDGEPISLENMPRPHRRRREKKLMTMDEVNERFPLTKYKAWVATRASEGLPTAGGVAAVSPNRAVSVKQADGAVPSSPVDTKHSVDRPGTAASARETPEVTVSSPTSAMGGTFGEGRKSTEVAEKATATAHTYMPPLAEVNTNATGDADKAEEEEDEEDHIHDALPPELLTTPGDSCAICIDTIEEDDDIRGLTCGHAFHASCLDPWLTSRRACCPLCKADYYIPKPRPEGEAAEAERPRRNGRLAMPTPPGSAWTGIRGNRGMMFPGRGFMSSPVYGDGLHVREWSHRRAQEVRRASQAQTGNPAPAPDNAASTRLLFANPFRGIRFPGRARTGGNSNNQPAAIPAPAQLDEVVVR
jgi:hypothetical protein